MPKRHYLIALACYLSIPVVLIAGVGLFCLIDPEMARSHTDYVRDYRLLETTRMGVLLTAAGLALLLWVSTCYQVLNSRQRSLRWLPLAAAGPFGFVFIAMLADRSPAPNDRYQQFIGKLSISWRVSLEIALFVSVWMLAFGSVVLKRELMIGFESFSTGTSAATIIDRQNASSGMWAFAEGLEAIYLVTLLYLLWPIFFNLVGQLFQPQTKPVSRDPRHSIY